MRDRNRKPDYFRDFEKTQDRRENDAIERYNEIFSVVKKLAIDQATRDRLSAFTDVTEFLVRGLPLAFTGSLYDAAELLLRALGFGQNLDVHSVFDVRDWNALLRSDPAISASLEDASSCLCLHG